MSTHESARHARRVPRAWGPPRWGGVPAVGPGAVGAEEAGAGAGWEMCECADMRSAAQSRLGTAERPWSSVGHGPADSCRDPPPPPAHRLVAPVVGPVERRCRRRGADRHERGGGEGAEEETPEDERGARE